ncbi:MAG: hypothetical protein H0X62_00735 [Bacteroidetes bacterium]|nr:hypothetical protein [Bacteroidota bacterium]
MKDIFDGNPSVTVKKKHVQVVIDHCLDKKVEFIVKPGTSGIEEWLIEFNITNLKKAVLLGMFLRENRLDLTDMSYKSDKAEKATEKQIEKPEPAKPQNTAEPAAKEEPKEDIKSVNLDSFSFAFGEEENAVKE